MKYIYVACSLSVLMLSGCGSGGDASTPTTQPLSAEEQIIILEESGAIPKLERTSSVAGIDINANGIRDDVETFITTSYFEPAQRAAAEQFASVIQAAMLVDKSDTAAVKATSVRSSRSVNCIYTKFDGNSGDQQPGSVVNKIRSVSTNTKERLLEYLAYSKALDGTSVVLPDGDTCE